MVQTGGWLRGRQVLLPPSVVEEADWPRRRLLVPLTKQQIEDSPDVDTDKPISRQHQMRLDQYPAWGPMGSYAVPLPPVEREEEEQGDPYLRSAKEVTQYRIEASDGEIGHVAELILDDRGDEQGAQQSLWAFRYLVADTRNWLPGKKVLLSPEWIESIRWEDRHVHVNLTRQQVEGSPEYDPELPVNRRYEELLFDYYGLPKYWGRAATTPVESQPRR